MKTNWITIPIILLWSGAWALALQGAGRAWLRLLGVVLPESPDSPGASAAFPDESAFITGFTGFMAISVVAVPLHFFLPLTPRVSLGFLAGGLLLFFLLPPRAPRAAAPFSAIIVSFALFMTLSVFLFSEIHLYDSGLYHLQAVRWIRESRLIPGLANLHSRLGFNTSWFPLSALLDPPPFVAGEPAPIGNMLLVFFHGLAIFRGVQNLFEGGRRLSDIFIVLTFIPWLWLLGFQIPSLSNNPPVFIASWIILWLLIREGEAPDRRWRRKVQIILLSLFTLTVKLSALGLAAGACIIALYGIFRRKPDAGGPMAEKDGGAKTRGWRGIPRLPLLAAAMGGLIILVPWLGRGAVLSGGPFFPARAFHMAGFKWSVPETDRRVVEAAVQEFARGTLKNYQKGERGAPWLKEWLRQNKRELWTMLFPGLAGLALLLFLRGAGLRFAGWRGFLLPWSVCIAGAGFWFVAAPGVRFGYGFLHGLALLPAAFALKQACDSFFSSPTAAAASRRGIPFRGMSGAGGVVVLLAVLFRTRPNLPLFLVFAGVLAAALPVRNREKWLPAAAAAALFATLLLNPFLNGYLREHMRLAGRVPEPPMNARRTEQGVPVSIPVGTDQCWDSPTLCSPYFKPHLRIEFAPDGKPAMFHLAPRAKPHFSEGPQKPEGAE